MAGYVQKIDEATYRLHFMYKGQRYSERIHLERVKKDYKTDKQVQLALANFIERVQKSNFSRKNNYKFVEYSQIWLDNVARPTISPVTVNKYIIYLNKKILPFLGNYQLDEITPLIVNDFYNMLKDSDSVRGGKLANSSVKRISNIASSIMQNAYQMELIDINPFHRVKLQFPPTVKKENENIHYYDREQYKHVLNLLENETLEHKTVIQLALKSGARRSELWGLTWNDIDFKNKTMSINRTRHYLNGKGMIVKDVKTKTSRRTIILPDSMIDILKEYKNKYSKNEYIFENISIDGICSWFKKFQIKNNITPIRFHDLRHTHATLLLLQGIDLKTIQHRLGHSNISMTMDVYTHVLDELDKKASNYLDNL